VKPSQTALGQLIPAPLAGIDLLHVELWQWVGLLALALAAWLLSWLAERIAIRLLGSLVRHTRTALDDRLLEALAGPLRLLIALGLVAAGILPLNLADPARDFVFALGKGSSLVAVGWLGFRLVDAVSDWIDQHLIARGQEGATAIVPLGRRTAKLTLAGLVFLAVLDDLGVNVGALLAGLGVGGLAVALAAKTTIENFFGGVSVVADRPVSVGDFCRFGDRLGTVEDIGLRSTRVRTLDRTVVTIPNSSFARFELENYSRRDRIWYHPTIGLRYETTPDQLRYVLIEIRRMLYAHPKVHPDPARVRFTGFGACSLNLEVFAYVDVNDYNEYLEVAEDLNLRIIEIVERAGSGFAFPSQTAYVRTDEGLDVARRSAAEQEVDRWREEKRLYLPRFPAQEIARLRGTLAWPPPGAADSGNGSDRNTRAESRRF
jgi:MscS family membrane protein